MFLSSPAKAGQMARIALVSYRPRKGKEAELIGMIRSHFPILRREGFITDRKAVGMRAGDGTILAMFEWISEEAVTDAATNASVQEIWMEVSKVSDFIKAVAIKEFTDVFPTFETIEIEK
jgi:hypothetical protein